MSGRGLYECNGCEYQVYKVDGVNTVETCSHCNGDMKRISVPPKGWLTE